jgi:hypothetical protein
MGVGNGGSGVVLARELPRRNDCGTGSQKEHTDTQRRTNTAIGAMSDGFAGTALRCPGQVHGIATPT